MPRGWITGWLGAESRIPSVLAAVPVGAALELCSEGFSVFAGQLYQLGATLGAVFVILMGGVTTDVTELSVVWGKFGRRSAVAYLLVGLGVTLLVAFGLEALA